MKTDKDREESTRNNQGSCDRSIVCSKTKKIKFLSENTRKGKEKKERNPRLKRKSLEFLWGFSFLDLGVERLTKTRWPAVHLRGEGSNDDLLLLLLSRERERKRKSPLKGIERERETGIFKESHHTPDCRTLGSLGLRAVSQIGFGFHRGIRIDDPNL